MLLFRQSRNPVRPLTRLDSRPRGRILRRNGIIDIDHNTRISSRVRSRERNLTLRAPRPRPTTNTDLRTADIKLFPSVKRRRNDLSSQDLVNAYLGRCAGVVDPELLNSEEVFAVGDAFWDAGRVRV